MSQIVNTLTLRDPDFPDRLRHIEPTPKQLFWMGAKPTEWLNKPTVSVVGSRKVTPYGRSVTSTIAGKLAQAGVVIISGLALGVDSIAHEAALSSGGQTVAVMPGGLDRIYPASHRQLAIKILKRGGSLVSEHPFDTPIRKYHFVVRSRIVAALCDVLLITEAAIRGGTLHTARFALEQGKTVMAVPGNITSASSEGCNNLIKSGAIPVTDVSDVFFALGITPKTAKMTFSGTALEVKILELIQAGVVNQEELALALKITAQELASQLTMLEVAGQIRPVGAGQWVIA